MRYLCIFVYCAYFAFALVLADQGDVVFPNNYDYPRNKNQWQQVSAIEGFLENCNNVRIVEKVIFEFKF